MLAELIEMVQYYHWALAAPTAHCMPPTGGNGPPLWTPEQVDEAARAANERAWAAARATLLSRGLPASPVDIDCYLVDGTPEASSDESGTEGTTDGSESELESSEESWDNRAADLDEMGL